MDLQTLITFGIGIVALACFFGTMVGVQRLLTKGKDPGKALQTAEDIEGIIDTVLKATQAGVHSAEQLYQCNQLPPDLRKDKASEYAINMIKLTGREVTPELEQSIRDTAEGAVFIMKQQEQKEQKADLIVPVPVQEQRSPIIKTDIDLLPVIVN